MANAFAVDIVCADRRHEKRVVSLATFGRDDQGRWHIRRRPGERRWARQAEKRRAAGKPGNLLNVADALLDAQPLRCKLCGGQLSRWRDKATMVPVLDRLAVQHDRLVSISQLKDLLATKA